MPADVPRRVRREHAQGVASYGAIARVLTADRVPTAQGGARWYPATVSKLLATRETAAHR